MEMTIPIAKELAACKTTSLKNSSEYLRCWRIIMSHLELLGDVVSDNSGEGGEKWGQEDAHIAHFYGDVERIEEVVHHGAGHHQPRVDGA